VFSLVSDTIVALSAAFVAAMAFIGLNRWRKELGGKAKFELARGIMLLSLKVEANFKRARHPVSISWESTQRKRKDDESQQETELLDAWYARVQRLQPLSENLQRIQELAWEAEVLLDTESGRQVSEAIEVFMDCYAGLATAIDEYFAARHEEIIKHNNFQDQDWLRGLMKEIYGRKDDTITKKVTGAKELLASTLKQYVK